MKTSKKILSILLAVMMILSIIPLTASAATVTGTCGENLTWEFDDSTGTLTISGVGAMTDFDSYHSIPWVDSRQEIEKVIIDDGVTTIGNYAFNNCYNIKSVKISDNVASIGHFAFFECRDISMIMIPDGVTTIGMYAFADCSDLQVIAIPDSITLISRAAFEKSTNLTDVYYSGTEENWNGIIIESENELLLNATINFDGYNDGTILGTCGENLTWTFDASTCTLTISGTGAMDDYESYNSPWETCRGEIENVVIENGVTTIGEGAFYDCDSLTSVTIGDSVTTIGGFAFIYCDSLTSVIIPDSVTTIGDGAFAVCESLASVTLPDSVTTIGSVVFFLCFSLTNVTVDSNNQYYSSDEYGVLFNKDKTTIIQYPIGNTRVSYTIPDSVTSIGASAFEYCDSLTSVTIPDGVTIIGLEAFCYCTNLTSITIPDSVTTIEGWAFCDCTSLSDVYYFGTEAQWNAIEIDNTDNFNAPLLNATIHFMGAGEHAHDYTAVITAPSCTEKGFTTYTCSCGDSYVDDYVDATGHTDNDNDGYCDNCDELLDPSVECDHNCHKGGISGFFWKIANFFNKLFRTKQYCSCGVAHY